MICDVEAPIPVCIRRFKAASFDGDTITYTINDTSEIVTEDIAHVSLFVDNSIPHF